MDNKDLTKISKFISLVLRHEPGLIGIQLDAQGWTDTQELLAKARKRLPNLDMALLEQVVAENNKKRFSFNADKSRIRANQGHSVEVDLDYAPATPPEILFHGTVADFVPAIRRDGLRKMSRHHVHLSPDRETATIVAARRGKALLLEVRATAMVQDGHVFFLTPNGVWLTEHVPPQYILFP